VERLKKFLEAPQSQFLSKGGVGYGVDETQKVEDDGKGYIWVAAEMSPGGLALEQFTSVPYGKKALFDSADCSATIRACEKGGE